jgi:oligopeptide/dipeptide ABC transporter ATP-binding protein
VSRAEPAAGSPVLEVHDLVVSFPTRDGTVRAVRGVDLVLAPGASVGIVGESGSGKSVTMLAVMGLLPPSAVVRGTIRFRGEELLGQSASQLRHLRGSRLAMVFQDPMTSLNPVFTVGNQVAEAVRVHRHLSKKAIRARVIELLELVSIPDPRDRIDAYPFELSGGMRQRVMIAMAMANDPDLLIADEPTTALDVTIQAQILDVLKKLRQEHNIGVALITHDLGVVAGMVERVAVMYAGRIVEQGAVRDIFATPRHPYTRALLACLPRLDRPKAELLPITGSPPSLIDLPSGCAFHPRCPYQEARCRQEDPRLRAVGVMEAACHLAEEIDTSTRPETRVG